MNVTKLVLVAAVVGTMIGGGATRAQETATEEATMTEISEELTENEVIMEEPIEAEITEIVITAEDSPTPTAGITESEQKSLSFWFLVVTIGLLAMIIVIQAWPQKKEEEGEISDQE